MSDKDYYSYCLQANLKFAIRSLSKNQKSDSKKIQTLRKKVLARFVTQTERAKFICRDSIVAEAIKSYRDYYLKVLLSPKKNDSLEKDLNDSLRSILAKLGRKRVATYSTEKIEKTLAEEMKKRDYYSLFGKVAPFRSLLVWEKQYSKTYTVPLPEKKEKVQVVFMDKFVELGWLHYATFGRYYVGGWAKKDALFCVKQAYKVDTPSFMAHYLAHEAQHFADYKSYPKLSQIDLEYRAKLAELFHTRTPKKFIQKLISEAKNDRLLPHSFAAYRIVSDLKKVQTTASFKQKAVDLLEKHSKSLSAFESIKVQSVL